MSYGLVEQIDRKMVHGWEMYNRREKPWVILRKHNTCTNYLKKSKHRVERRKMKQNLGYYPAYNKYHGWEY